MDKGTVEPPKLVPCDIGPSTIVGPRTYIKEL